MLRLRDFAGAHYGEAIVVCGLGASINSFHAPERFHTIGVNDISRAFTPTYLFVMDAAKSFAPERFAYIKQSRASYIFSDHDLGLNPDRMVNFPIRKSDTPKFDDPDALYLIGRPPTSPFLALCLAAHMGAKAIGLVGVDFTDGHFFAADGAHKLSKGLAGINRRFYTLGSALLQRGVKIFNLSAESRLNAFPRLHPDAFYDLQSSGRSRSWSRPVRRICLLTDSAPDKNLLTIARLINTKTTLSCRLIGPESQDIRRASTPEIERDVLARSGVKIDCAKVAFPNMLSANGDFLARWNRELRPLLFSSAPRPESAKPRSFSLSVIVVQDKSTDDEAMETMRSLWADLRPDDDICLLGSSSKSGNASTWLRHIRRIRYVKCLRNESLAAARNRIAAVSNKDVLVFTDANIQAPTDWVSTLLATFRNPLVGAAGPAICDLYKPESRGFGMRWTDAELRTEWLPQTSGSANSAPLLPGVFLAVRRSAFVGIGGFDSGMRGIGGEDMELCFRLWTAGWRCVVCPKVNVQWMNPCTTGAVRGSDVWPDVLHNLLRLVTAHFNTARRRAFDDQAGRDPHFASAQASVETSDIWLRRAQIRRTRRYTDKWFFERFPI
jgi:glycosyltransferase involved in cell wall biosynthesis